MGDPQVQLAQGWLNRTYGSPGGDPGYVKCPETGITGWSTMYSLTRALQIELHVPPPRSDNFGNGTLGALAAHGPITADNSTENLRHLVQAGLWCKGYLGGYVEGAWDGDTASGIRSWKTDMGLPSGGTPSVDGKQLKGLFTMDAYTLLPGGSTQVRAVQQWLNATFLTHTVSYVVPCDGLFSAGVQRELVKALQYSLDLPDSTDGLGRIGDRTTTLLAGQRALDTTSADSGTSHFVRLFKAGLIANRQTGVDWASTAFTAATVTATKAFQRFCGLPVTGQGDYATWLSLLLSTGDPQRLTTACDCLTPLNGARAKALAAARYTTVLRYLTGGPTKALTPAEVRTVFANRLALVPIMQESNNNRSLFTAATASAQATSAHAAASALRLPAGATIYFAVDFDATDDDATLVVLPWFQVVTATMTSLRSPYKVGVYGARNVCSRVSAAGYAVSSFVGGISTEWSGNLGFPLPSNWAFDQIQTITVAPGKPGQIEIDKDVSSGRDPGIRALGPKPAGAR